MASLTDAQGRPAFHPECPRCRRERFAGAFTAESIVGRRAQAVLAAGVLVLSSATPSAVLAAEPDHEQAGVAAPEQVAVDVPPDDPAFDPGGQPTDLPFDATTPAPTSDAAPDPAGATGPVEQEPVTNEVVPTADPGDGSGTPDQQAPLTPDPAAAPPAAVPEPQLTVEAPPSVPTPEPAAAPSPQPAPGAAPPPSARERETTKTRQRRNGTTVKHTARAAPAPQPVVLHAATGVSAPTTVQVAQSEPAASSSAAVSRGRAAQRGDRFHVVRRDESLWSIAGDLLGDGASVAEIARQVNRLWELNSARIGTGDPDLLLAGTRLALR